MKPLISLVSIKNSRVLVWEGTGRCSNMGLMKVKSKLIIKTPITLEQHKIHSVMSYNKTLGINPRIVQLVNQE